MTAPAWYRKRPVEIEAMQWDGTPEVAFEIVGWICTSGGHAFEGDAVYADGSTGPAIFIDTLEGQMSAAPGHWIIRGVEGEFYPCRADIFAATYETPIEART